MREGGEYLVLQGGESLVSLQGGGHTVGGGHSTGGVALTLRNMAYVFNAILRQKVQAVVCLVVIKWFSFFAFLQGVVRSSAWFKR